jgi:LytS/YehU family sensor histidine kinase
MEQQQVYIFFTLLFFLMIAIGLTVFFYVKWQKTETKKTVLEADLSVIQSKVTTLQLQTLEAKLSPHLFRNILNSIQSHAYQTYYSLDKLANVLDYILYESQRKFVTPNEEIEFALNLIEINKIKLSPLFELKVKKNINEQDPLYQHNVLASMISVNLIENAFKHADLVSPNAFISIVFEFKDGVFGLLVSNVVSGRENFLKDKGGIGLKMMEERLKIIYGSNFTLERHTINNVYSTHLKINLVDYKSKMPVVG